MNIAIAKFKYDKGDGSTPKKQRKLLVLSRPQDSYFGIEFNEYSEIQNYFNYLSEKECFEAYLKQKYNLSEANYKRFKVDKILALTEDKIVL